MEVEPYFDRFTERDWQTIERGGPIRFAVVGLGWFARDRAIPGIHRSTFCETTVAVSGSPRKAADVASEFDIEHCISYEAFKDGTAQDAYDAVYIAVPNRLHLEYAVAAAEMGKHVLCEKPLETTVERAERMVETCSAADVTLMTAYRLRTEPAVRRMREMVRDGFIGDPIFVVGGFFTRLLEAVDADTWRLDPEMAGGGALIDIGIYPLNTGRFLMDSDPISVSAMTHSTTAAYGRVEEHVTFQLTFENDAMACCAASFNGHPNSRLQVLGTEGQLRIDAPFGGDVPQHIVAERGDMRSEYTGPPVDEVVEEFDYFAHCLLTGGDCESAGEAGLADLRIIDAAYESATTGRTIDVEPAEMHRSAGG